MAILQFFNGKPPEEQEGNSIEKFWLQFWIEKSLTVRLEILNIKKM